MNFESEIAALEEKSRLAMLHSNLSVLDSLIADELLFVAPDGSVLGKAVDLELHRSGTQRISQLDLSDLLVRIYAGPSTSSLSLVISDTCVHGPGRRPGGRSLQALRARYQTQAHER